MDWNLFLQNPWIGFIGTMIGVVGVALSIVFYYKTRHYKKPSYFKGSLRWYDSEGVPDSDLKLLYHDRIVDRFTITQLAFWNAGNESIKGSDFTQSSPLRLQVPTDIEIFEIRLTTMTTPEIAASIGEAQLVPDATYKQFPVSFEYLDRNDGFTLQIVHNGKSHQGIDFVGKLPGVLRFTSFDRSRSDTLLGRRRSVAHSLYTPPFVRWVVVPTASLALGGVGLLSIYWATFREFHWYLSFGMLFVIYFFMPFTMFLEPTLPKPLYDALTSVDDAV